MNLILATALLFCAPVYAQPAPDSIAWSHTLLEPQTPGGTHLSSEIDLQGGDPVSEGLLPKPDGVIAFVVKAQQQLASRSSTQNTVFELRLWRLTARTGEITSTATILVPTPRVRAASVSAGIALLSGTTVIILSDRLEVVASITGLVKDLAPIPLRKEMLFGVSTSLFSSIDGSYLLASWSFGKTTRAFLLSGSNGAILGRGIFVGFRPYTLGRTLVYLRPSDLRYNYTFDLSSLEKENGDIDEKYSGIHAISRDAVDYCLHTIELTDGRLLYECQTMDVVEGGAERQIYPLPKRMQTESPIQEGIEKGVAVFAAAEIRGGGFWDTTEKIVGWNLCILNLSHSTPIRVIRLAKAPTGYLSFCISGDMLVQIRDGKITAQQI
jgi:hypothetical protein